MTNSRSVAQLDATRPLFVNRPPAVTSEAAVEATELAASAGLVLDPWQVADLEVLLGERADGQWAAREGGLIVPRQNGKGGEIEAIELAALFVFGDELILHSAHEFKTAAEGFLRLKNLIDATADLSRMVRRIHEAHGSEGIELTTGQRIRFVARSRGSGRGFSGDRIILDEAYDLSDAAVSALGPTMAARTNPQILYTSSHPLDEERSDVLRRIMRRGRSGDARLAYVEYAADVDLDEVDLEQIDLDDRVLWAQANPAYPHRLTGEAIDTERGMMSAADFARERLGIVNLGQSGDQIISDEDWADTLDDDSAISGRPAIALEVSPDRGWSAFGAAGTSTTRRDDAPLVHGELIEYRSGTGWVVARAKELAAKWDAPIAVAKGSPAASLIAKLEAAKVEVVEIATEDLARFCGDLYDGVTDAEAPWFVHRDQAALEVAVRGAVKKDHGDGAWVLSRKRSTVDITPLLAVTIAVGVHGRPSEVVDLATQVW